MKDFDNQVKEFWNISEKDWLNLTNHQQSSAFLHTKKYPGGASIHRIDESFPLKPSLVVKILQEFLPVFHKFHSISLMVLTSLLALSIASTNMLSGTINLGLAVKDKVKKRSILGINTKFANNFRFYSSNKIRKTQNEHLNIVYQNLSSQ